MDLEWVVSTIKENILVVLTLVGLLVFFGYVVIGGVSRFLREVKLDKEGVIGSAVVTRLKQHGTQKTTRPKIELELEVTLPGHAPYRITKVVNMPMIYLPRVQPGMSIEVAADPRRLDDPKYLAMRFRDEI